MVEDDRDQLVPNHDENGAWGRSFSDREEEKIKLRVHLGGATIGGKRILFLFEKRRKDV